MVDRIPLIRGHQTHGGNYIYAPPLVNLPQIAPVVSAGLAAAFLFAGLMWAIRSSDKDIAFSIMMCVIVAVSPISWDHYYIMIVISLVIMLLNLSQRAFPNKPTILCFIIALMLFLFNEYISQAIFALNGGVDFLQANGNRISFASSLLETLPIVELVLLTILLWRAGVTRLRDKSRETPA